MNILRKTHVLRLLCISVISAAMLWSVPGNATGVADYRAEAEAGNALAQFALGECYKDGKGITQDCTEAVKWFRKAAEQGFAKAQCKLADCYYWGKGVEKSEKNARIWYLKAEKGGNSRAHNMLEKIGRSAPEKYIPLLDRLEAMWEAQIKDKEGNPEKLLKSAQKGDAESQFILGFYYLNVKHDHKEGAKWLQKASEQGLPEAQTMLAFYYCQKDDLNSATKWFQKAAEQGIPEAQTALALLFIPQNPAESAKWIRKAAKQGMPEAQCVLASFYQIGLGVKKDTTEAVKLFRKAEKQGLEVAIFGLAVCYQEGTGVKCNKKKAARLYQQFIKNFENSPCAHNNGADENPNNKKTFNTFQEFIKNVYIFQESMKKSSILPLAHNNLGDLYKNGAGVTQDMELAAEHYYAAAKLGYTIAFSNLYKGATLGNCYSQYSLARCYKNGYCVPQDYEAAYKWGSLALLNGSRKAENFLTNLSGKLSQETLRRARNQARREFEEFLLRQQRLRELILFS